MPEIHVDLPYDWNPRDYQTPLWEYLQGGGKRAVAVWHRRAGKDLFTVNWIACQAMQRVGLYWHMFPKYTQGRKVAWEGATKAGRRFLHHFPDSLIKTTNDNEMKVTFKNGSVYQVVGSDEPDRLVGANPVGVVFSEYSISDPRAWDYVRPILAENEGWAIFIYTPRGQNHGWDLFNMAAKNPKWFCQKLGVTDTKAVPKEVIEDDRNSGMPEEMIQQEYECSFEAPLIGAYYASGITKAYKDGRVTKVPYDPILDVHTAWDLGMDDATTIWFFQYYERDNTIRVLDYLEQSGEGLLYYAKELQKKPYRYGKHFFPFDVNVREMATGKTRLQTLREIGIKADVVPKLDLHDGIDAVRNMLGRVWFDETNCARGLQALKEYRKEWDEKRKCFSNSPLHDWASHGADAFRQLALSFKEQKFVKRGPLQKQTVNEYDPLSR
jgi:phage terminase large subunit